MAVQPSRTDIEAALSDIRNLPSESRSAYPESSALRAFSQCISVLSREALLALRYALEGKVDSTLLLSTEGNILCFKLEVFVANSPVMAFPAGPVGSAKV